VAAKRKRSGGGKAKRSPRKPTSSRKSSSMKRKATKGKRLTSKSRSRSRHGTNTKAGRKVTTNEKKRGTFAGKNGAKISRTVRRRNVVVGGRKRTVKEVTRVVRNAAGKVVGKKTSTKTGGGRAGGGRTQAQKNKGFRGTSPKKARQQRQKAGNRSPKPKRTSSRKPRAARSTRSGGVTAPSGRRRRRK
jgi:hypothetical protein